MRKKVIVIATALSVLCGMQAVFAQNMFSSYYTTRLVKQPWRIGLYAGWARNSLYQGGAENAGRQQQGKAGDGWTLGVSGRYKVFNWLSFQVDVAYITKVYQWDMVNAGPASSDSMYNRYVSGIYQRTTNGFLEFPLLLRLSLPLYISRTREQSLEFYALTGVSVGAWRCSIRKGRQQRVDNGIQGLTTGYETQADYTDNYSFSNERDNRFEAAYIAGAGVEFSIKAFSVFTEFRYNLGLTDLQKRYVQHGFVPAMNDTWTLTAGITVNPDYWRNK
jgi:hypothetical protein